MRTAFARGSTALHAALELRQFEAAAALLEAGADPNSLNLIGETPLSTLDERLGWAVSRGAERARSTTAIMQLLEAGADPMLPLRRPFAQWSAQVGKPCLDWLVEAHASGRRQLAPPAAITLLQAAVRQQHEPAYAALLLLAQQQHAEAPLSAAAALRTLMVAARHGTVQQARDALALGANPAAPEAAPACLLAQAAMHRRISHSEGLLTLLLWAQLRVEDLLKVVEQGGVLNLRRLLRIGTPQVCVCCVQGWAGGRRR
jgi:hypothetical protein